MSRGKKNEDIQKKIAKILAMPDFPKKQTQKQIFSSNAIVILERLDTHINTALYLSKN